MDRPIDIALNKPANQSSLSSWSHGTAAEDASRANSGYLHDDFAFHTAFEIDPWWQVDLQDVFVIDYVHILNRKHCFERLKFFSVLLSLDGYQWNVVYTNSEAILLGFDGEAPLVLRIESDERVARYLRIRLDGEGTLHFRSCQVFGRPVQQDQQSASFGATLSPKSVSSDEDVFASSDALTQGQTSITKAVSHDQSDIGTLVDPGLRATPDLPQKTTGGYILREFLSLFGVRK